MYRRGPGLHVVASSEDHEGFDGVMLGFAGSPYHFEYTRCRAHPVAAKPTPEIWQSFTFPRKPSGTRDATECGRQGSSRLRQVIHTGTFTAEPSKIPTAIASSYNKRHATLSEASERMAGMDSPPNNGTGQSAEPA